MPVKSIAEYSENTFDLHKATICHSDLFVYFLSDRFTHSGFTVLDRFILSAISILIDTIDKTWHLILYYLILSSPLHVPSQKLI